MDQEMYGTDFNTQLALMFLYVCVWLQIYEEGTNYSVGVT